VPDVNISLCFNVFSLYCSGSAEDEQRLSKEKLHALSLYPPVHKFVRKSDYAFFQALVEVLIPDVLRPIPSEYLISILICI
jgi:hypothetical protein